MPKEAVMPASGAAQDEGAPLRWPQQEGETAQAGKRRSGSAAGQRAFLNSPSDGGSAVTNYQEVREELFAAVQKALHEGLLRISEGNLSMRTPDGHVAITPSGVKYKQLKPDEIAVVDLDGNHVDGPCKASSETPMHTTIMRNLPEVGAICHTHSPFAMTFAVAGKDIALINLEAIACGAPIPVAPWATPGSAAGGEVTVALFRRRPNLKAVLLRNHGLVAIGGDAEDSFDNAFKAEVAAQVYHQALQIGEPVIITQQQMQETGDTYAAFTQKKRT